MSQTLTPVTGNTELTRPENRAFFPALDGLRGTAFILVFLDHYTQLPWGWAGVNVFFVLSGFLITGILYDSRNDPHRVRNFYVRRTLRIFPLYYGIFLILLALNLWFHWNWSVIWIAWPLYLGNILRYMSPTSELRGSRFEVGSDARLESTKLHGSNLYLGHLWSLCAEEQFYLLWPWVVFRVRSARMLKWVCGIVIGLVLVLRAIVPLLAPEWMLHAGLLYSAPPFQLDALLLGGLLALLWRGPHRERLFLTARITAIAMAVIAIFYIGHTLHFTGITSFSGYVYPRWGYAWGLVFVNILSASILVCALRPKGVVYRIFDLRPLRWIGRISYGAYVFHDLFHDVYQSAAVHLGQYFRILAKHPGPVTMPLAFCSTLLLAWMSFRFFESPFLNLKERWTLRSATQ